MKAGGTSRPCNSATNAALLCATVSRNSRILGKCCSQMLLRLLARQYCTVPYCTRCISHTREASLLRSRTTCARGCSQERQVRMALRAVSREVRRAAKRLDASPLAAQAHGTHSFDADALRSMMNIKAFLLPELPYSPEAMAYASNAQMAPLGALSFTLEHDVPYAHDLVLTSFLSDSLSLLKELGAFEHSICLLAAFH